MGSINYNEFITNMMRFASVDEDPEIIIDKMMQYLCENLQSDRAYIFEENEEGSFDNTYEFCREGVPAEKENLQGVPYENMIECWYKEYEKYNNILIYDIEEYRPESEGLYQILKPQGIRTLVTGPITVNGKYIGFYGVDNPPVEILHEISELINMMEYIIAMMLRIRNYARMIQIRSERDMLTGCKNRKALNFYYENVAAGSLGLLMCDLNGLKKKNDTEGHLAGDRYIRDFADALMLCFDRDNVYRLGGDEFLVVEQDMALEEMQKKIDALKLICDKREVSVSLGFEYRKKVDTTFEKLLQKADDKMYEAKRAFYGK